MRPESKVRIHGFWYSTIHDRNGQILGGSIFRIQAGVNKVDFTGDYRDLTLPASRTPWSWWSGEGEPYGDGILYAYWGEEDGSDDRGYGQYSFPRGGAEEQIVRGSYYGLNLPKKERDRTVRGERVPKAHLTRAFRKDRQVRRKALEEYLERAQA